jgi:acetoacetyl-CoA reductase
MELKGKNAIVTGAARGLGRGIALKLAEAGANVALVDLGNPRDPALTYNLAAHGDLASAVEEVKSRGVRAAPILADVTRLADCERMAAETATALGSVDILINNAGITRDASFKKLDKVNWDAVLRTNLDSVFNMTKPVCDSMVERGWGRIINVSSIIGSKGGFGQTNYAAAKAGMHGFTKSLALEVAKKGVTVNTISPGYIATKMVMAVPEEIRETKIIPQIPVGRLGQPDEVAALVLYLCSREAGFVTGANIAINGGQHLQ